MTKPHRISISVLVLSILLVFSIALNFIQFSKRRTPTVQTNASEISESLDFWLGDYIYDEFVPPNINQRYALRVYKENGSYLADISVDGFQADYSFKAKAVGNSRCIQFLYAAELNEKNNIFNDNDHLLSFVSENGRIQTVWEALTCSENNRYFEKLYTDYYGVWQITESDSGNRSDSRFGVGDKLSVTQDQLIAGDIPLTVTSRISYARFPDFLQQKATSGAVLDALTRGLLYEGTYAEIALTGASGDILSLYPFSDSECLIVDAQNAVYRAVKLT